MKYKIEITKAETKTVTKRGDFTVIEERPWTKEELDEATDHFRKADDQPTLKQVRGYAPNFQEVINTQVKVLEQTVEDLDLAQVIKAINNL